MIGRAGVGVRRASPTTARRSHRAAAATARRPTVRSSGRCGASDGTLDARAHRLACWCATSAARSPACATTVQDISIRKRIEEALERERQQLLGVIADAPVSMAMFDREMRYLAHSRKWVDDMNWPGRLAGRAAALRGRAAICRSGSRSRIAAASPARVVTCPEDSFRAQRRLGDLPALGRASLACRRRIASAASSSSPTSSTSWSRRARRRSRRRG